MHLVYLFTILLCLLCAETAGSQERLVDPRGREVATLLDAHVGPGEHAVSFRRGNLPAGFCFCRLATPGFVMARKLVVVE